MISTSNVTSDASQPIALFYGVGSGRRRLIVKKKKI